MMSYYLRMFTSNKYLCLYHKTAAVTMLAASAACALRSIGGRFGLEIRVQQKWAEGDNI
jgi:hypothetical protein